MTRWRQFSSWITGMRCSLFNSCRINLKFEVAAHSRKAFSIWSWSILGGLWCFCLFVLFTSLYSSVLFTPCLLKKLKFASQNLVQNIFCQENCFSGCKLELKNIFVIGLKQGLSFGGLWPFYLKMEDFILLFIFNAKI